MFRKLFGLLGGGGLRQYLMIALAVSIAANAAIGYLYKEALQDTARVELQERLERALAANETAAVVRVAEALAAQDRVTELRRRLERSDAVARESAERETAAREDLTEFEASLEARELAQPDYLDWAKVELPDRIVEGLKALTDRASAEGD